MSSFSALDLAASSSCSIYFGQYLTFFLVNVRIARLWKEVADDVSARLLNGTLKPPLNEVDSEVESVIGCSDDEGYQTDSSMPALIY